MKASVDALHAHVVAPVCPEGVFHRFSASLSSGMMMASCLAASGASWPYLRYLVDMARRRAEERAEQLVVERAMATGPATAVFGAEVDAGAPSDQRSDGSSTPEADLRAICRLATGRRPAGNRAKRRRMASPRYRRRMGWARW